MWSHGCGENLNMNILFEGSEGFSTIFRKGRDAFRSVEQVLYESRKLESGWNSKESHFAPC